MEILRQGDVVIVPSKVPRNAKSAGSEIRITSETGNAHVIRGKVLKSGSQQYIVLEEPTPVEHPGHAPLTVPAGTYQVRTVRDYIPRRMLD